MNNGGQGYDIGDVAEITVYVKDGDNALVDADTIEVTFQRMASRYTPVGDPTVYDTLGSDPGEIERTTTGTYKARHPLTASGFYRYRAVTTGVGAGAEEGEFYVRTTTFTT